MNTAELLSEDEVKRKEHSSKTIELNIVFSMKEEQWIAVEKFYVMMMMELWWHTSRLHGTVMGGRLSFTKKLFNGVSFPNQHLN